MRKAIRGLSECLVYEWVLANVKDVKKRWKEYFEKLLNKECPREVIESRSLEQRFDKFNYSKPQYESNEKKKAVWPYGAVPAEEWTISRDVEIKWLKAF